MRALLLSCFLFFIGLPGLAKAEEPQLSALSLKPPLPLPIPIPIEVLLRLEPPGLPSVLLARIRRAVASMAKEEGAVLVERESQARKMSYVLSIKLDNTGKDRHVIAKLLDLEKRKSPPLEIDETCGLCDAETLAEYLGRITKRLLVEALSRRTGDGVKLAGGQL